MIGLSRSCKMQYGTELRMRQCSKTDFLETDFSGRHPEFRKQGKEIKEAQTQDEKLWDKVM